MTEKIFKLTKGDSKTIERIIADENINYNHMVLPQGEALPVHTTNSNVYMTVVRGVLTISLENGGFNVYESGTVLKIPNGIRMDARNGGSETLELIVVKAPAPNTLR